MGCGFLHPVNSPAGGSRRDRVVKGGYASVALKESGFAIWRRVRSWGRRGGTTRKGTNCDAATGEAFTRGG